MDLVLQRVLNHENEINPLVIHKIVDEEIHLKPGEKKEVTFFVFPRRTGYHSLKGFKAVERKQRNDRDAKGYTFSLPKFSIEDN